MKLKSHTVRILTAAILSLTLGGCVSAVIGSAAVGTKSVIDRRTTGAQTDDNVMALRIETTARSYLRQNNQVQGYTPKISVVGYNRHLLLLGQVATEGEKQFVGQIARSEQAAEGVYNYITVARNRAPSATSPTTLGIRPKSVPHCWALPPQPRHASKSLPMTT